MEREKERYTDYQKLLDEKVRSNEIKVYNLASAREPSCPQHDFHVSDEQAEALIKSGAREFGNFAYTDYGSLGDVLYGAGDYMLTEYFRQHYPVGKDDKTSRHQQDTQPKWRIHKATTKYIQS
jgi:hypothetical protein